MYMSVDVSGMLKIGLSWKLIPNSTNILSQNTSLSLLALYNLLLNTIIKVTITICNVCSNNYWIMIYLRLSNSTIWNECTKTYSIMIPMSNSINHSPLVPQHSKTYDTRVPQQRHLDSVCNATVDTVCMQWRMWATSYKHGGLHAV